MKRLLVALALVGTLAVQAANERLETIRTALADLVELAGPEALTNKEGNDELFISCSDAEPFAKGCPSDQTEDPEIAADASAPAAVGVPSPIASLRSPVTALQLSGTLKTATGKLSARGEVTSAHLRLWTIAGSRHASAEMYRKISTSVKSEKKLISKVAGRSYTVSKLKLKIDKKGKMKISGKTPKNRKVSASCYPHICDGAVYYRFVFTPTGAGGNGYYIYLKLEGSDLRCWELSF